MAKTVQDGGVYKHSLARVEVESLVKPLYDKEPTPAWMEQFKATLKHFRMSMGVLGKLASEAGKANNLGHRYTNYSLYNALKHYEDKVCDWTENAQKTVNDHLDILIEYLCRPDDEPVDPKRCITSYGIKDIYPQVVKDGLGLAMEEDEEPKSLLQRLEESGRKPFLPKSGYETVHKSEYVPYKQEPKTLNEQRAEIGLEPVPVKVKLTKVHIIRR